MTDVMWIIMGMMVVTFIPRLLPFYLIHNKELPKKLKRFLNYIPVTALGALIVPGAIVSIEGRPWIGLAGFASAVSIAYFKGGIMLTIIGSIAVVFGLLTFL